MFDPRRDQLGHLEALVELVSQFFVELRIPRLRDALHLRARLCDDGEDLLLHLHDDRTLDGFHERCRERQCRRRGQRALRMCRQSTPQRLGLLLQTRDGLGIFLIRLHQL